MIKAAIDNILSFPRALCATTVFVNHKGGEIFEMVKFRRRGINQNNIFVLDLVSNENRGIWSCGMATKRVFKM